MNKIQRVSYWFRLFFQACFILLPILMVLSWVFVTQQDFQAKQTYFFLSPISPNLLNIPVLHPITFMTKLSGMIVSAIPTAIYMLIFYYLIQLFKLYQHAEIFTLKNVNLIRNIGYAMLASQLFQPIYQGVLTFILTINNPHGSRYVSVGIGSTDIIYIAIALMIILVSWIMAEGRKLQDEQRYTV